jgi:hypothetical protein
MLRATVFEQDRRPGPFGEVGAERMRQCLACELVQSGPVVGKDEIVELVLLVSRHLAGR